MQTYDLRGRGGNAMAIVMLARGLARQLEWTHEQRDAVQDEMLAAGSYEKLLDVFLKHFGEYVQFTGRESDEATEETDDE